MAETKKPVPTTNEDVEKNKAVANGASKISNKVLVIVLAVVGALVVLGLLGSLVAGSVLKGIFESLTGTKVETSLDGSTKFTVKDGDNSLSVEQKLSSDFPKSVPLYSGQKIISSSKLTNESNASWTVSAELQDGPSAAATKLKSLYEEQGWALDNKSEISGATWLYYKKDQLEVNLYLSEAEGKTNLTYAVNETAAQ